MHISQSVRETPEKFMLFDSGSAQHVPETVVTFLLCIGSAQTHVPTLELHKSVSRMQV